ncbi:hypothetical protein KKF91_06060 [Myxococcota bacterium]|nr:hypothetical protein [Myxococcota bacterium]MBU1430116.1 hypothetical protein [Myxococcota bacterium]MBU1900644.1 hypothetical protein [Myxococcota bacterium]
MKLHTVGLSALVVVGLTAWQAAQLSAQPSTALPVVAQLTLHGNTPTLAWSPDSKKIVTNEAWDYMVTPKTPTSVKVLEVESVKVTQLSKVQGYHPFFIDDDTVVWGHSQYEEPGEPGLFKSKVSAPSVERITALKGVNHTLPAKNGQILLFSGWPDNNDWIFVNPQTYAITPHPIPVAKGEWIKSWDYPKELVKDICIQKVGDVSVKTDLNAISVTLAGKEIKLAGKPYRYEYDGADAHHKGPVKACLSPDGRHVAYFADGPRGDQSEYTLKVVKLR